MENNTMINYEYEEILSKIQEINNQNGVAYNGIYHIIKEQFPSIGDNMANKLHDLRKKGFIDWSYEMSGRSWKAPENFPIEITESGEDFLRRPFIQKKLESASKHSIVNEIKYPLKLIIKFLSLIKSIKFW